jgi:pyruvate/oxaloacetate carboxyltransferase
MVTNFKSQLDQLGLEDRLPEVLEETPQVRADFGYPNMQTPFSQFIATQALLNVLYGRYTLVPDEVRRLALGYWGRTPGPIDPNVLDRVTGGEEPITVRPGEVIPPVLDRVRREQGPFRSDEDLLLAVLFMPDILKQLADAGPMPLTHPLGFNSLVGVVRQAAAGGIRRLSLVAPSR